MVPLTRVVLTASTLVLATFTAQAVVPYRITDLGVPPINGWCQPILRHQQRRPGGGLLVGLAPNT